MDTKKSENIVVGITLSFAACFLLFLYAPLETYFTNVGEFWFDIYLLLPPFCVLFLCFFGTSVLVLCLVAGRHPRIYDILLLVYFIAFICTYVQGVFLAKSLPILNGAWIEWSDYPMERIKCIVLWTVVTGIMLWLYKHCRKELMLQGIKVVCVCLSLVLLVTLVTLALSSEGMKKKENVSATTENLFTMSEDANYIILCLDGLSSYDFNKLREKHPEWDRTFADFTYYANTFGVYPSTRYTVPFLFSGKWYDKEEMYEDYNARAYIESTVLTEFERKDYEIGLYITDSMMPRNKEMTKFDNIISNSYGVNDWWAFIRWNVQIVGFKYAPFDFKRICFVDPGAFEGLKSLPDGYESHTGKNIKFYHAIKEEEIEKTSNKVFKYIHIDGAHPPFKYDEKMNEIDDATYVSSIEASITITEAYLEKLRENDVYNNSVIIVLADHGWDTGDNNDNALRWQTPILLIKGINEKHDFQISEAPISYVDMQEAFIKLLNGNLSDRVFEWKENDARERRLIFDNGENDQDIIYEYIQMGEAWNPDTVVIRQCN